MPQLAPDTIHDIGTFVGVPLPSLIYIGVADRAAFDLIDRPETDHRPKQNLLTKSVEQDGCIVTLQHWLPLSQVPA